METTLKPHKETVGTMVCIIISGPSLNEAREQVKKASLKADLLEFRLDQFGFSQIEAIAHLKETTTLPVIFTLRSRSHGGEYKGDEQQRLEEIKKILVLEPDYIDLEYDVALSFYPEVKRISPETKLISSLHDFAHTPKDLQSVLDMMKKDYISLYKIAVMANSCLDSMRMLRFIRDNAKKGLKLGCVCIGEQGIMTRILGPKFGNSLAFSVLHKDLVVAPGQLAIDELMGRYHLRTIGNETAILGLIGDPVSKSPSHYTHNYVINDLGLNAVYVKISVQPQELHEFIDYAKKLNFLGLSVTMPLKKAVVSLVTEESPDSGIGAFNTLRLNQKKVEGANTDGIGALNAIEEFGLVEGKRVIILGAGGAARAIAWEAKKRGAEVVILNRTVENAAALAGSLDCKYGSLNEFSAYALQGYDILVNSTSVGLFSEKTRLPIDASNMLEEKVVLDVIPGKEETPFLQEAKNKHCTIINGNTMLMLQAVEQFYFWFSNTISREELKKSFNEAFKTIRE